MGVRVKQFGYGGDGLDICFLLCNTDLECFSKQSSEARVE
jgi:hypothetical protein